MQQLKILIVDDHSVVREGLKYILQQQGKYDMEVLEAADRMSCLDIIDKHDFDLILMDINLGKESGIDLTRHLLKLDKELKIIALTMHEDEYIVKQMREAGAMGYLLKNTGGDELNLAIDTVLSGQKYFSYKVALSLLGEESQKSKDTKEELLESLTNREREILKLIVEEMTNDEIAQKLDLSKRTVDFHRQNLINKLQVKNTAGLVKFALSVNL